ncbi:uncharacterized protein C8R40DRAFT_93645 [Lentinula edodes]|uniref:uncharacterized protein n=1 Tax=Lentinula edodes TaxID=5353 RepID=UPI001E8D2212|nr:uncharacterized protein C8R40DRAFT_93645 [Lentinula edodes]KAH7877086.1 hypothetical protein C8R40DRAFT_93645 [Lentinula edodes]
MVGVHFNVLSVGPRWTSRARLNKPCNCLFICHGVALHLGRSGFWTFLWKYTMYPFLSAKKIYPQSWSRFDAHPVVHSISRIRVGFTDRILVNPDYSSVVDQLISSRKFPKSLMCMRRSGSLARLIYYLHNSTRKMYVVPSTPSRVSSPVCITPQFLVSCHERETTFAKLEMTILHFRRRRRNIIKSIPRATSLMVGEEYVSSCTKRKLSSINLLDIHSADHSE